MPDLPVDIDATYPDEGSPSRPLHQQHHDAVHALYNELKGSETAAGLATLQAILDGTYAPVEDAALTGTPTAPTAAPGTDTPQVATTAFVTDAVDNATSALGDLSDVSTAGGVEGYVLTQQADGSFALEASGSGTSVAGDDGFHALLDDGSLVGVHPVVAGLRDIGSVWHLSAGTATRTAMGADLTGTFKWNGGVLGPDGKIYGIPDSATDILVIDPVAGTATRTAMGADLTGSSKWYGGVLGPDGKIYGIPYGATDILVIDLVAGTASRSLMGATLSGSSKWFGGVLGPDGKIYGIPASATDILTVSSPAPPLPAWIALSPYLNKF